MEFNGFIYTYKDKRRFLDVENKTKHTEFAINGQNFKKFNTKGTWIISTNYNYLKTINLKPYIAKSKIFARILLSTEKEFLKFDLLENGKFKKQLIYKNGVIIDSFGIPKDLIIMPFLEMTNKLFENNIHLNITELEGDNSSFKNKNYYSPKGKKSTLWYELYLIFNIPRILTFAIFSPIMSFYIIKMLISIIQSEELVIKHLLFAVFILLIFLSIPTYLSILAYKEIRNYILLKTKLYNDNKLKIDV